VAIEAAYNDTAQQWWTFFDVELGGYAAGTDYSSPTGGFVSYIFAFGSARYNSGTWPGAIRTEIPKVGLDPGNAVVRDTNQAISALPVPASLKRP
jgi:hypothetical protein